MKKIFIYTIITIIIIIPFLILLLSYSSKKFSFMPVPFSSTSENTKSPDNYNEYNFCFSSDKDEKPYGKIIIDVKDTENLKGVQEATVCIPEANIYVKTDESGKTKPLKVPILCNTFYNNSVKRDNGELTIIIFKNGYLTDVHLYVPVKDNGTTLLKTVYLEKETALRNTKNGDYNISLEQPLPEWIKILIRKYRK